MSTNRNPQYVSPEEYLARERSAETKSEYVDGEIVAMSGASERHVLIVSNLVAALVSRLRERPCRVYSTDMKVRVDDRGLYAYTDVAVVCGERRFADDQRDVLLNPTLIIEVLSNSTEAYDRGTKFARYRRLESLQDYLLVSQKAKDVEQYTRRSDGLWLLEEYDAPDSVVRLPSIECELPLDDVYRNIDLEETEA
jgi:Uma2 family endonuclease